LRADLLADAGLAGLIGDRLYLVQLPQNPIYPCGVYQRVSTQPLYVQTRGRTPLTGGQATIGWARFSFKFWSNDGQQGGSIVESIANALMAAMETVNLIALPQSPVVINNAPNFLLTRRMGVEPQTQPPLYFEMLDFKLWYSDQ
jgi:hypothetical protein